MQNTGEGLNLCSVYSAVASTWKMGMPKGEYANVDSSTTAGSDEIERKNHQF